MKAIKGNKAYTVDEVSKAKYLARGFDIYEDDGVTLVQAAGGKMIEYEKYKELEEQYDSLREECERAQAAAGSAVDEVKAYAEYRGIDVGQATTVTGILKKIKEADEAGGA